MAGNKASIVCVQMLIDSGLRPKTPSAPLPAPVSLFKQPSEANVRKATQLPPQGLLRGPVWRSTVETQRIYNVRGSLSLWVTACFVPATSRQGPITCHKKWSAEGNVDFGLFMLSTLFSEVVLTTLLWK